MHVALLPVFPLLALGLVMLLWGRPRADVGGVATVVAWFGSLRRGPRVLAETVLLLGGDWSFVDSHIFHPRGVGTMPALAAGFALWTWAAVPRPRIAGPVPGPATASRV